MQMVRERLRAATDDLHQALHRAGAFARIEDGTIDAKGYGALLQGLHEYHSAMEAVCIAGAAALGRPELGTAQQHRVLRLKADLASLGLGARDRRDDAVDPDFAVGCLYTVLGSTLGGKVIFRQLENFLQDGPGGSFFKGTDQDGANWKLFCAALESFAQNRCTAQIEAGARHAFGRFRDLAMPQRPPFHPHLSPLPGLAAASQP